MDLNKASFRACEIAKKRGLKETAFDILKHCAGEVLEANEAYNNWSFIDKDNLKQAFEDELADVIMCILSLCGAENIDIEKALERCFIKNEQRGKK